MRSPRPRSRSLQAPITAVISCRPTYLTVAGVAPPGLSLQTAPVTLVCGIPGASTSTRQSSRAAALGGAVAAAL